MFFKSKAIFKEDERLKNIVNKGKFLLKLKEDDVAEFKGCTGNVSFLNCKSFLSALKPIFGFISNVFYIQSGYSDEYNCETSEYYSQEMSVTVDKYTGFVLKVSYSGSNDSATRKIKSFVRTYDNYSFFDTGTGFLIERD